MSVVFNSKSKFVLFQFMHNKFILMKFLHLSMMNFVEFKLIICCKNLQLNYYMYVTAI